MKSTEDTPVVVNITSLGCAKNLVDAEVMCGMMAVNGIFLTDDPDCSNVTLINTCGFIQSARDEATAAIRDAIRWKKAGRKRGFLRKVVICGCWAQRDRESILALSREIDAVVGLDEVPNIADIILGLFDGNEGPFVKVSDTAPTYLYDHATPRISATPPSFSLVKIAEGCNHRCSFCAIPQIRGPYRSRSEDAILHEIQSLAEGSGISHFLITSLRVANTITRSRICGTS